MEVREWWMGSYCLMGIDFPFGMMEKFWIWMVVVTAQQCQSSYWHCTQYFMVGILYHSERESMTEAKLKIIPFLVNPARSLTQQLPLIHNFPFHRFSYPQSTAVWRPMMHLRMRHQKANSNLMLQDNTHVIHFTSSSHISMLPLSHYHRRVQTAQ